jgi:hypothetical protein
MIKSQNRKLKLFTLFLFSFITYSITGFCDEPAERLILADSLFAQKKYTQSFDLYNEIYTNFGKVSPAMLLKMAFVKEGLGDYGNALYYLNLYYQKTYDKKVLKKMENLAEEHKLLGYEYDDAEFFLNIYQKYQLQFDLLVISSVLLILAVFIYQKRSHKKLSSLAVYSYIALLLILFGINNFGREPHKAIISSANVYLMEGPSPGSNVVDIISYGHRVKVKGKEDVWVEIDWDDKSVYVKEFNLKPIEL